MKHFYGITFKNHVGTMLLSADFDHEEVFHFIDENNLIVDEVHVYDLEV